MIKNFGLSPAFNVVTVAGVSGDAAGIDQASRAACDSANTFFESKQPDIKEIAHNQQFGGSIFPGQERPYAFTAFNKAGDGKNIYALGCIFYRDEFGTKHRTRFCEIVAPTADVVKWMSKPCDIYNDAD
jgi:hypothetical protein